MDNHTGYRQALNRYHIGLGLAVLLTLIATALVLWTDWPTPWALGAVFTLGLGQIIVHFYYFLHIGLDQNSRPKLGLLLFSALIILLMVAGSLLVFFDQQARMS